MIRSIKLVGLAFVAALALGAVVASTASATPLIHFTKEGEFSGKGGKINIETKKGETTECSTIDVKGTVVTEDRAHLLIEFLTCKGPLGSTCTTTEGGSEVGTKGNIHVLALALLGSDEAPPNDNPAVLITPENAKDEKANETFNCVSFGLASHLTVRNSIIGLVKNITTSHGGILLSLKKSGTGIQQDKKFWDESETNVEDFLETESSGAVTFSFEETSDEAEVLMESANDILIAT